MIKCLKCGEFTGTHLIPSQCPMCGNMEIDQYMRVTQSPTQKEIEESKELMEWLKSKEQSK